MANPWPIKEVKLDNESRVISFTVSRPLWYRGHGPQYSVLMRRSDKLACILGCYALACGHCSDDIIGLKSVEDIVKPMAEMSWLFEVYSPIFIKADVIAALNDYVDTADPNLILNREQELQIFFQEQAGIELLFED